MNNHNSSYRQIIKATSLFGGVQFFNIIITIVRSKFIAILLGPEGMGISGLLSTTTTLISTLTNSGLGISAVKNVAAASASGNQKRIFIIITIIRRWVWVTGTLGTIIVLILSPWLSQLTFGNRNYTLAFIWISITLLFNQLSNGQMVILQGMHKLQYLAKANLTGSLFGLIITVPLYYIWGIDGIVPAIIISSLISLTRSWYFSRKVKIEPVKISYIRTFAEGKNMLIMGFILSVSSLISLGASYIVRIYISNIGGIAQVGLYSAGFAIINTYVGLIFTAMGTDYYPRLSAVAHSNELSKQLINQQAEVALLILAPIIIIFLVFIRWLVILLYSNKFLAINDMIYWAALGMFFKATSWSIGYLFLAKGNSKLFFWNELTANIYFLAFNVLGYKLLGLTGLGISFAISFLCVFVQVYIISRLKFNFTLERAFVLIFLIQFSLALASFISIKFMPQPYHYLAGILLIAISIFYSFKELDHRIGIKSIIQKLKNYKYHKSK